MKPSVMRGVCLSSVFDSHEGQGVGPKQAGDTVLRPRHCSVVARGSSVCSEIFNCRESPSETPVGPNV